MAGVNYIVKAFLFSCCVILTITSLAKLYAAFGHVGILGLPDPLFGFPNRSLLCLAAGVELLVVGFLMLDVDVASKCVSVSWLATNFTLYRVGIFLLHPHKPCPCLGDLMEAIHVPLRMANTIMECILAYLFIGSYGLLFWFWRQHKNASNACMRVINWQSSIKGTLCLAIVTLCLFQFVLYRKRRPFWCDWRSSASNAMDGASLPRDLVLYFSFAIIQLKGFGANWLDTHRNGRVSPWLCSGGTDV